MDYLHVLVPGTFLSQLLTSSNLKDQHYCILSWFESHGGDFGERISICRSPCVGDVSICSFVFSSSLTLVCIGGDWNLAATLWHGLSEKKVCHCSYTLARGILNYLYTSRIISLLVIDMGCDLQSVHQFAPIYNIINARR